MVGENVLIFFYQFTSLKLDPRSLYFKPKSSSYILVIEESRGEKLGVSPISFSCPIPESFGVIRFLFP